MICDQESMGILSQSVIHLLIICSVVFLFILPNSNYHLSKAESNESNETSTETSTYKDKEWTMDPSVVLHYTFSPPEIVTPETNHSSVLFFLHDKGETGSQWAYLLAKHLPNMKIVCPNANLLPVSRDKHSEIKSSWFPDAACDDASDYLQRLIEEEVGNGTRSENIFLGGFSQGGALALQTALECRRKLGGVFAVASWLTMMDRDLKKMDVVNKHIPNLLGHGDRDSTVPCHFCNATAKSLKLISNFVDMKIYHGVGHVVGDDALDDMVAFLKKLQLPA